MLFAPFSYQRFSLDWVFIIDLTLTGILLSCLLLAYLFKNRATLICQTALVLGLVYISVCAVNHRRALNLAKEFAAKEKLSYSRIAALPQPLSSMRWANLILTEDKIYRGLLDFSKDEIVHGDPVIPLAESSPLKTKFSFQHMRQQLDFQYSPPAQLIYKTKNRFISSVWVDKALKTSGAEFFLWFARFPIVKSVYEDRGHYIVELFDLRFQTTNDRFPFLYTIEFDKTGKIIRQGFAAE